MKFQAILEVADDHPALRTEPTEVGVWDIAALCKLAFSNWEGISVESVEPMPIKSVDQLAAAEETPIGQEIRDRRVRLGLSMKALAESAGIDRGGLQKIETGVHFRPRGTTLSALTRALDDAEAAAGIAPKQPPPVPAGATAAETVITVTMEDGLILKVSGPSTHSEALGESVGRLMDTMRRR